MKQLNGAELAGFIKERQAHQVRSLRGQGIIPKLVIVRDSDNPVIAKYVSLKKRYGEDIGVEVEDIVAQPDQLAETIAKYNQNTEVDGVIVQLPLQRPEQTAELVQKICTEKDVDDLAESHHFDGATATAINWLLAGYNINLENKRIAIVGRGRLVGAPLIRMWQNAGLDIAVFGRDSDLSELQDFDMIVTATGQPHLITSDMVRAGAVVVDAGTASENGVLVGDVDDVVRERDDLTAITPLRGGVGPLTVSALFENVLISAQKRLKMQK